MAFGLKKWIWTAVLACGLVTLTLIPSPAGWLWDEYEPRATSEYWELNQRSWSAQWALRPALEYLTLLERRDSALAVVQSFGNEFQDHPMLLIDERLPESVRSATESVVARQWQQIARQPNGVAVVVSVQLDTADKTLDVPRRVGLGVHLGYTLPTRDNKVCFTIVNVGATRAERLSALAQEPDGGQVTELTLLPTTAPELLGPCAYYGAFGMPGVEIERWLETVNHVPALLPTWVREPPFTDAAKTYRTRNMWPQENRTVDLYPCASGEHARCRSAVLSGVPDFYSFRYPDDSATTRPNGVVKASKFAWAPAHPLGLGVRSFLADLVADMGQDHFARFWTSDEPVDIAFATAFGLPLEDWTMKWAREQVGTPLRGPATSPGALLQGFLLAALFVGIGVVYGTRREVG